MSELNTPENYFTHVFSQLKNGNREREASAALHELTRACQDLEKSGELKIKITVKPDKGNQGQVQVIAEIDSKIPRPVPGSNIMFTTPEGLMQITDPAQGKLDFSKINQASPAISASSLVEQGRSDNVQSLTPKT